MAEEPELIHNRHMINSLRAISSRSKCEWRSNLASKASETQCREGAKPPAQPPAQRESPVSGLPGNLPCALRVLAVSERLQGAALFKKRTHAAHGQGSRELRIRLDEWFDCEGSLGMIPLSKLNLPAELPMELSSPDSAAAGRRSSGGRVWCRPIERPARAFQLELCVEPAEPVPTHLRRGRRPHPVAPDLDRRSL
jgi:hypothetical protein